MKKNNTKTLSFMLIIMLVVNFVMPTTVFATEQEIPEDYVPRGNTVEESSAEVIKEPKDPSELQQELDELTFEIISLRGENVKHFHLPDGTYQAVVYGEPVHKLNSDGEWEEIDNTLTVSDGAIATGDSRVKFAKKITGNESLYTLHNGNYKVTVGLVGAQKKTEGVVANQSISEEGMTKLQKLINVDNIASSVTYSDILDGVDLEYLVVSNSIKENIIVKKPSDGYSYTFTLDLNGLIAKLENGNILLCDSSSEEVIYCIPAPYMYDSEGNESFEAYYSLTSSQNGRYEFTLCADAQWINSIERSFPVIIDPSLVDIGQIDDTYVTSSNTTGNFGGTHTLWVSSARETYYKFATPNLPDGTYITSATVKFPYYFDITSDSYISVNLYQITSNWYEDYVTWNTKPSINSTCLDTRDLYANGATVSNPSYASFTVTDYVRSWYTGTANRGFALKRAGGTALSVKFVAKEKMQKFAQLTINYTGTHLAEGVYAIGRGGTNYYFKSYIPENLAWVLQDTTSYSAPPLSSSNLENLFKITYRPEYDDYVIRSMLDSSLVIYPSVGNNAPIAGRRNESDSQLSTSYTWKIEYTGGFYYITHTKNGTKYYIQSAKTGNDSKLIFTTNASDVGTKWSFHKYTGNVYEDVEPEDFDYQLAVGDTHQYVAYMRSTRIGHNGPVKYRVGTASYAATDVASINSTTGELTALKVGTFKVGVTYSGAPWVWWWTVTIDGYVSADLAALAFATEIYAASLYIRHEYSTEIYKVNEDGRTLYYYTEPAAGSPHSASGINMGRIPSNGTAVAYSHTHPNSNSFSSADINYANHYKIDAYFNGPNLEVNKYDYSSGQHPLYVDTITPTPLTTAQKQALQTEFYDSWHDHIVNGVCSKGFSCGSMSWPTP
ncbi:MAG: DNRLRE domain-containing protein [Eubacteriales bacterium]